MDTPVSRFTVEVEQENGFEFKVRFDRAAFEPLRLDEPPPLGHDRAPNAVRILAAAVGNCLAASLVFCMQRRGVALRGVRADCEVEIVRNPERRQRVGRIDVTLRPQIAAESPALAECLPTFEEFCTVTQSVRRGIQVSVRVEPEET